MDALKRTSPASPALTGVWIGIAAITMSFAAYTSALVVRQGAAPDWRHFRLPPILFLNTALLLASSGTLEIWDVVNDKKQQPYVHEPNGVRSISAAPQKKLVAWATGHRKVRVLDITTPSKPIEFPQPCDCPAVALNAAGTMLAVANDWTRW